MRLGIGDFFDARVAGNIVNDDVLGSMEFACKAEGSKLILVLGHTGCGANKGAIDNVQLGHLSNLLARIRPAMIKPGSSRTCGRCPGAPLVIEPEVLLVARAPKKWRCSGD